MILGIQFIMLLSKAVLSVYNIMIFTEKILVWSWLNLCAITKNIFHFVDTKKKINVMKCFLSPYIFMTLIYMSLWFDLRVCQLFISLPILVCYIFFKLTLLTSFNNENVYRFIRWNAESRPEDSALFWAPTTDGLSCLNNISYAFPTKKHPEILNF